MAKIKITKRFVEINSFEKYVIASLPQDTTFISEGLKFRADQKQIIVTDEGTHQRYGEFAQDSAKADVPIELHY